MGEAKLPLFYMKQASIILDLGFGDSGKGKKVDWLCTNPPNFLNPPDLIVRFSGGQQAGHTVINQFGKHIHSSFPSGTLSGVAGYIMEHCVVSPLHLRNEYDILVKKKKDILLTVHPLAHLTTPYEIAWNRIMAREGETCGLGVGATMKRNLQTPHHLYAVDLTNPWVLRRKMSRLHLYYHSLLLEFKQLNRFNEEVEQLMEPFLDAVDWFVDFVEIEDLDFNFYDTVVFEGSQGILLDMDHGIFPYVTYANTTSKNIAGIIRASGAKSHTFYVTRTYSTRHGSGPLLDESSIPLKNTDEEINVHNQWQGEFRLAPLDESLLEYAMRCDMIYSPTKTHNLCVTCADQLKPTIDFEGFCLDNIYISDTPRSIYEKT